MDSGQDRGVSASEAARRVGVAVSTLRSWDRRYGLGPETRIEGRHRRYRATDLARLLAMRRLTDGGVSAASAARLVRAASDPALLTPATRRPPAGLAVDRALSGRLWRAAMALDRVALDGALLESMEDGVASAWQRVICPAIRHVGNRVATSGKHVESEHLLSVAVSGALARVTRPTGSARVILACAPEEQHTLALEALDAALGERGVASRLLGARVPVIALNAAIERLRPSAVVLWAQTAGVANVDQIAALLGARPRPAVVIAAGPGWDDESKFEGVHRPTSVAEAVSLLANASSH